MLSWYVYRWDFNSKEVYKYNVFDHPRFFKEVMALKSKGYEHKKYSEELRRLAMYYFWSKCEYETVITSWPPYIDKAELDKLAEEDVKVRASVKLSVAKKIDVFDQLLMNWDTFAAYTDVATIEVIDY